ncbi:MAG: hypothetical protein WBB85_23275 [Albidovulum sp.]|uniref:hypothetical protein n=1 Tax=Albidovulum sp. TaxID=1872424 RepID=UPI003C88726F
MPKRLRLTRRFAAAMSNDAYRALTEFAGKAEVTPDEALTFLFENFRSVTDNDVMTHRLRLFKAKLEERKA